MAATDALPAIATRRISPSRAGAMGGRDDARLLSASRPFVATRARSAGDQTNNLMLRTTAGPGPRRVVPVRPYTPTTAGAGAATSEGFFAGSRRLTVFLAVAVLLNLFVLYRVTQPSASSSSSSAAASAAAAAAAGGSGGGAAATHVRHVFHRHPDEVWHEKKHDGAATDEDEGVEEDELANLAHPGEIAVGAGHVKGDVDHPHVPDDDDDDDDGNDAAAAASASLSNAASGNNAENNDEEEDDEITNAAAAAVAAAAASGRTDLSAQIQGKRSKTFVYFRSKTCSYLCVRAKALGWKPGILDLNAKVYPTLLLIRWNSYDRYKHLTKTIINQVGSGSSCIGGGKGIQLLCRQQLAARGGCEYGDLGIQPKQWNLQKAQQCEDFFTTAADPENTKKVWIVKPGGSFHGRGITLHRGDDAAFRLKYGACGKKKLSDGLIVQSYIMNPALMGGHKFDLRSYLLIASTAPFLVFYHDGFARRSEHAFSMDGANLTDVKSHITNDVSQSNENHFFGFEQLEQVLIKENKFPSGYMERHFRPTAMRVSNYLFHTAADRSGHKIQPRPARYQFFAADWMIDAAGGIHLLEANGDPTIKDYAGTGLTPELWDSMLELEELVHLRPEELGAVLVRKRFAYKGWRLVYNQLEAVADPYQPCKYKEYVAEKHPLYGFADAPPS